MLTARDLLEESQTAIRDFCRKDGDIVADYPKAAWLLVKIAGWLQANEHAPIDCRYACKEDIE